MGEDKRFEATAGRIARAKREGDLPRSHDLGVVASLAAGALALAAAVAPLGAAARLAIARAARPHGFSPWPYAAIAACAFAVPVASLIGALVANYLQTGAFALVAIAFKLQKLSPVAGIKRMLGRDAFVQACKAVVVTAAVALAATPSVVSAFAPAVGASPARLAALVDGAVRGAVAGALAVGTLFGFGDALLERTKWKRRLRMTFEELRRDHKASEGDPHVRGRRRQAHRALVRGSIARVREAAFVVANPTHVAIALAYRPPEIAVPRVLVRAVEAGALEVKRLAREHRVPIVENVALARALLAATDVGDDIPESAYAAVAAIVASLAREGALAS